MSALTVGAILFASFLVTAAILAVFQTRVRLSTSPPTASANFKRCVWVAFVAGVWWPYTVWVGWTDHSFSAFASLSDQRVFLLGFTPALWVLGVTSTVPPWAHSIRPWLLGANLVALGLACGLFLGTAAWPGSMFTIFWIFWTAVGFGCSIRAVLRSRPGQAWGGSSSLAVDIPSPSENGARG